MPTLKWLRSVGIGTVATVLPAPDASTGPAIALVWVIPKLYLTNVTAGVIKVTVSHVKAGVPSRLAFARPVAVGDALVLESLVLLNGDSLTVLSDTAASIDAYGSVDEEDA